MRWNPLVVDEDGASTRFVARLKVGKSVQHANLPARSGEGGGGLARALLQNHVPSVVGNGIAQRDDARSGGIQVLRCVVQRVVQHGAVSRAITGVGALDVRNEGA